MCGLVCGRLAISRPRREGRRGDSGGGFPHETVDSGSCATVETVEGGGFTGRHRLLDNIFYRRGESGGTSGRSDTHTHTIDSLPAPSVMAMPWRSSSR